MNKFLQLGLAVGAMLLTAMNEAVAAVEYTITNLGGLSGGSSCSPNAINNHGVVVGQAHNGVGMRAFKWVSGTMTDLGVLGTGSSSIAYGISDTGDVVGVSNISAGVNHPFLVRNGIMYDLMPSFSTKSGSAMFVNDKGEVIGSFETDTMTPFHWTLNGSTVNATNLRTLGFYDNAYPQSINNYGQITGWGTSAGNKAFLYQPNPFGTISALSVYESFVKAMNDSGMIAGSQNVWLSSTYVPRAFLWVPNFRNASSGICIYLGVLATGKKSLANALNSWGVAVGQSNFTSSDDISYHAFIWSDCEGIRDLNDLIDPESGWILERATGINDKGQICGIGTLNGSTRGFILDPV